MVLGYKCVPCYYPLTGYRSSSPNENGKFPIVFSRTGAQLDEEVSLPCGRCIGCRLERSKVWAIRCMHEAAIFDNNCFVTLTYDNDNLPDDGSLIKSDWQLFMKRLRKRLVPKNPYSFNNDFDKWDAWQLKYGIRFFMCGEYGQDQDYALEGISKLGRPHYHAILFNYNPMDLGLEVFCEKQFDVTKAPNKYGIYRKVENSANGSDQYDSSVISKAWGKGRVRVSHMSFEAAAYVARYCTKKLNPGNTPESEQDFINHYTKLNSDTGETFLVSPEFNLQSQGIGKYWFKSYKNDLRKGFININGSDMSIPAYYEKLMNDDLDLSNDLANIKAKKTEFLQNNSEKYERSRLEAMERIKLKQLNMLKREL